MMFLSAALLTAGLIPILRGARAQVAQPSIQETPQLLTQSPPAKLRSVDWIFILDTSASMSGAGPGSKNIFPLVKETLRGFIPSIQDEDSVAIFEFDVTSRRSFPRRQIRSASDRNVIGPLINDLVASGARTHTGAALADALNDVYSRQDKGRPAAIILLTDGHEDVTGIKNPIRIPEVIELIRDQDVPYVFYVSLGTELDPQLLRFLDRINKKAPGRGKSFDNPGPTGLPQVADEIRKAIINARPAFELDIQPKILDLRSIRPGGEGGPFTIDFGSKVPAKLDLALINVPPGHFIEGIPDTLDVGPERIQRVQFTVKLGEGASEGIQSYKLRIVPPAELDPTPRDIQIDVNVRWTMMEGAGYWVSTGAAWIWYHVTAVAAWLADHWLWLLLIILIILILVYFFRRWYIHGEYPWETIRPFPPRRIPAILHTPEKDISLTQSSVTLGEGGSYLKKSTAKINIHREGERHRLIVEKESVVFTGDLENSEITLNSGESRKLEHNDRLIMPGYRGSLVYLNSSRRR